MSESLQQIQENIQVKVRDAGNTDVAHFGYKIVVATLTVTETVVFDPRYPVEQMAIDQAKRQVLDKLYENRYKEIAEALYQYRKAINSCGLGHDIRASESFENLAQTILGKNCYLPPTNYQPSEHHS